MGYTPLFDSLTKGTLCGRWPDIGLWPIVLSLSDRHGVVDSTPTHIAAITGLALLDVVSCMKRFCEPDPYSRSQDNDGARLELLETHRDWGWRIVNHGKYRERARKQAYDSERTASGLDAERKRQSRGVPTCPDTSRSPDGDEDVNKDEEGSRSTRSRAPATHLPDDFELTSERRAVAEAEKLPAERTFAKFCNHWRSASGQRARKRDWDATWRNWCMTEIDRNGAGNGTRRVNAEPRISALERVRRANAAALENES